MEKVPRILIADDDDRTRMTLCDILVALGYSVIEARNGKEALIQVESEQPDVILLDMNMPEMGGLEVLENLKLDRTTKLIPIVVITGDNDFDLRIKALKLGADDFLNKPPHIAELTARVRSLVKVKAYNDYMKQSQKILEDEVRKRTKELNEAHVKLKNASLDTIYRLSTAAEFKDEDTSLHLKRMSNYAAEIAKKLDLDDDIIESIHYSAPMHDIGKIGIPDRILLKPGKLDNDEWELMRQHSSFGARILKDSDSDIIKMGHEIAKSHHEKWDGSGYPLALKGDKIPLMGRITALADVFDALSTKRPYKEAFSDDKAFGIIEEGSGTHFDPEIVDAFLSVKDKVLSIKTQYQEVKKEF